MNANGRKAWVAHRYLIIYSKD